VKTSTIIMSTGSERGVELHLNDESTKRTWKIELLRNAKGYWCRRRIPVSSIRNPKVKALHKRNLECA